VTSVTTGKRGTHDLRGYIVVDRRYPDERAVDDGDPSAMTRLLQEAFRKASELPEDRQDLIGRMLLQVVTEVPASDGGSASP
jgi:hypothetical protein